MSGGLMTPAVFADRIEKWLAELPDVNSCQVIEGEPNVIAVEMDSGDEFFIGVEYA